MEEEAVIKSVHQHYLGQRKVVAATTIIMLYFDLFVVVTKELCIQVNFYMHAYVLLKNV
jgi:hypothetical protein